MRRPLLLLVSVLAALAGCSPDDEQTPAACLVPAGQYLRALEVAPDPVRLDGTPISDCLVPNQAPAEQSQVGEAMIQAATELNAEARGDPGGDATVELGYLVGAVQQGAEETGGIHADLVRRLDAAARFSKGGKELPVAFERGFGIGYAAGQESG